MSDVDIYRAVRRFERMLPEVGELNRLRATDPERYDQYKGRLDISPIDTSKATLVSTIIYDPEKEIVKFIPANRDKKE